MKKRTRRSIVSPQPQPQPRAKAKKKSGLAVPKPSGLLPRGLPRSANNTTCDIYFSPNVPPASPDVAGVSCSLVPRFPEGSEASEGDQTFRWTHVLCVDLSVDVRDTWPSAPAHRVYVPDSSGTGFDVVFVELLNRGSAAAYKRVYLKRRAATFPTNEL